MKRQRGIFRSLAKSAKERLSGNFWQEVNEIKTAEVSKAERDGKMGNEVLNQFITCVKSKIIRKQDFDPVEEQLYLKVREVLCSAPFSNPLAAVLDRDLLCKLGDSERERYVFGLSEKVKACVKRFEQESAFDNVSGI